MIMKFDLHFVLLNQKVIEIHDEVDREREDEERYDGADGVQCDQLANVSSLKRSTVDEYAGHQEVGHTECAGKEPSASELLVPLTDCEDGGGREHNGGDDDV